MYNHKYIADFIDKVNEEASQAAQKVYDKYQHELIERIKNQIKKGDRIFIGMGTASVENKNGETIAEKLAVEISQTQYWNDTVSAGFLLNDISK